MSGSRAAPPIRDLKQGAQVNLRKTKTMKTKPERSGGPFKPSTSTVREASAILGASPNLIYRLIAEQKLRAIRVSHSIRIVTASIWEFIDEGGTT